MEFQEHNKQETNNGAAFLILQSAQNFHIETQVLGFGALTDNETMFGLETH